MWHEAEGPVPREGRARRRRRVCGRRALAGVVQERDEQLDGERRRRRREARAGYGALLVERTVARRIRRSRDVAAEVAAEAVAAVAVTLHHERVEAQRDVHEKRAARRGDHGREPPAFARVGEQEHAIRVRDERVERVHLGVGGVARRRAGGRERVARHGDR